MGHEIATKKKRAAQAPVRPAPARAARKNHAAARAGGVRLWKSEITCSPTVVGDRSSIARTSVINDSGSAVTVERIVDDTGMFPDELDLYGFAENTSIAAGGQLVLDFAYRPQRSGPYHVVLQVHLDSGDVLELVVKGSAQQLWRDPSKGREAPATESETTPAPRKAPAPRKEPEPSRRAPAMPALRATVNELDIWSTANGTIGSAVLDVHVERGDGPIYFHARDGFFVKEPRNGTSVEAGQTIRVEVHYRSRFVGTKQSRLVIQPSFGPSLSIRLRGHGKRPDVDARVPKARVPVLRRPPEPAAKGKEKLAEIEEASEKDKVKDGEDRKVRVDDQGVNVDLGEEWGNAKSLARDIGLAQVDAIESMKSRLKAPPEPVDSALISRAADHALIAAAAAIADLASTTLSSFLSGASAGTMLAGKAVIAGIKDVIKARIKRTSPAPSGDRLVDNFIDTMRRRTKKIGAAFRESVNNRTSEIARHPEGPRIAKAVYHAFTAASAAAEGYQTIEIASQWANLLATEARRRRPLRSGDARGSRAGRPGREVGASLAEGMIEVRVAEPLIPAADIHLESAHWSGISNSVADAISGHNDLPVTLARLRVPYRVVGEGGLLIERWPGESRPRIGLTSEYWLADYWGARIGQPHLSRSKSNNPNQLFVKRALERLLEQLDNETVNSLGLTDVAPGTFPGTDRK